MPFGVAALSLAMVRCQILALLAVCVAKSSATHQDSMLLPLWDPNIDESWEEQADDIAADAESDLFYFQFKVSSQRYAATKNNIEIQVVGNESSSEWTSVGANWSKSELRKMRRNIRPAVGPAQLVRLRTNGTDGTLAPLLLRRIRQI